MKNKEKILIAIIIVLTIALIIVTSLLFIREANDNNTVQNNESTENSNNEENNNITKPEKQDLSSDELQYLQNYIDNASNNVFVNIAYNNPNEILTNSDYYGKNTEILRYGFFLSEYAIQATDAQKKEINNGEFIDVPVPIKVISGNDMVKYLKEKANLDTTVETLKEYFDFEEKLNLFYFAISDSSYFQYKITESYKIDNKYYLTLSDGKLITLIKENNNYYFYSCNR